MAHLTASGKRSDAWKALERIVAEMLRAAGFRAERITRGDDYSAHLPDVDLKDIPRMAIDTKYKHAGFSHHTKFEKEVQKYVDGATGAYDVAIMPTRSGKSKNIYVTLLFSEFVKILAKAYLNGGRGGWSCPRCNGMISPTESSGIFDLKEYSCTECLFLFATNEVMAEVRPEPVEEEEPSKVKVPRNQKKPLDVLKAKQ